MIDLLKPIVTSAQIDYSVELSGELLEKVKRFATGADANIPGRGAGSKHLDNRFDYVPTVCVSLFGDLTADPVWHDKLNVIINESHLAIDVTSNFDRAFDDEDLLALAKLNQIHVSIDSSSPAAMQNLRSADLRAIIANIVRLRQAMLETDKKPELNVDCTVTRDTLTHLGGVARLASILQVDVLNIGDSADDPVNTKETDGLEQVSDTEAHLLARSLIDAVNTLKATRTKINVLPNLKNKLEPVIVAMSEGRAVTAASFRRMATGAVMAGPCMQPWNTVIVQATGGVKLCRGPVDVVGDLRSDNLINLVNGPAAREMRAAVLEGGPNLPCNKCAFSTADKPDVFLERVRRAHEEYDAAIYPWQASIPTGMNYDAEHGIKTEARIFVNDLDPERVGAALQHATPYIPTPVADVDRMLDAVPLPAQQCTLIDLGCGMGRVLLHAAKRPFRQIVGVEVSPALVEIARKNLDDYKGALACRDIVLVRADASEYVFPSGDIVVYMFNPFTDVVLKPVLERLSLHAGQVVIAYRAPLHAAIIDANPRFSAVSQFALTDARNIARLWQSRSSAC